MTTPDFTTTTPELECLDHHNTADPCAGAVEYRHPLSGTGRSFPRCDHHWDKRLQKQQEINERYAPDSDVPPSGFDPYFAGERWEEDY
jgi:hypothetical protein